MFKNTSFKLQTYRFYFQIQILECHARLRDAWQHLAAHQWFKDFVRTREQKIYAPLVRIIAILSNELISEKNNIKD